MNDTTLFEEANELIDRLFALFLPYVKAQMRAAFDSAVEQGEVGPEYFEDMAEMESREIVCQWIEVLTDRALKMPASFDSRNFDDRMLPSSELDWYFNEIFLDQASVENVLRAVRANLPEGKFIPDDANKIIQLLKAITVSDSGS